MARRPRNYLSGFPYHLVQRGVNRSQTFFNQSDYAIYLKLWRKYSERYKLDVHAFCLMPNHIHFLITPHTDDAISATTRCVGSNYTSYVNQRYDRTGTLWEARHKSSLVDSAEYLLKCYRYIELNPLRAGLVKKPGEYTWSSFLLNISPNAGWLSQHTLFESLGNEDSERARNYYDFVMSEYDSCETFEISQAISADKPLGRPEYFQKLQEAFSIQLLPRQRGRPPRERAGQRQGTKT